MTKILVISLFLAPTLAAAEGLPRAIEASDYRPVNEAAAELGQLLFYDPILSGNKTVACATCHHPRFGTGDGVSLSLGDGGIGLGPERVADPDNLPEQRIPRNAPGLWNLGAREFRVMFHDGRLEQREDGIRTPLGADMVDGFESVLSAQTMFPVLSADEMAGHYSENDVAQAVRQGLLTGEGGAWDIIARRVAAIPAYADAFEAVYNLPPADIGFIDISNAIASFMELEWRSDTAPFDAHLRGESQITGIAAEGMALFYGPAACASCHMGPFLTDHSFHAMGEPQLGPGKAARFESHARDDGRLRVTGQAADAYAFRTPSLRNVALTAPYGHAGAYADLGAFVQAHVDPVQGLADYERAQVILPVLEVEDWRIMDDPAQVEAIGAAVAIDPMPLTLAEIGALVAFLETLTDSEAAAGRLGIPDAVPSGLDVPR